MSRRSCAEDTPLVGMCEVGREVTHRVVVALELALPSIRRFRPARLRSEGVWARRPSASARPTSRNALTKRNAAIRGMVHQRERRLDHRTHVRCQNGCAASPAAGACLAPLPRGGTSRLARNTVTHWQGVDHPGRPRATDAWRRRTRAPRRGGAHSAPGWQAPRLRPTPSRSPCASGAPGDRRSGHRCRWSVSRRRLLALTRQMAIQIQVTGRAIHLDRRAGPARRDSKKRVPVERVPFVLARHVRLAGCVIYVHQRMLHRPGRSGPACLRLDPDQRLRATTPGLMSSPRGTGVRRSRALSSPKNVDLGPVQDQ